MTDLPPTLASPQFQELDRACWIATAVVNPAIALVETGKYLGILLAKNATIGRTGTTLDAVRHTRIPQGWRLWLLRLRSRLYRARLPDEWLYSTVELIGLTARHHAVVRPGQEILAGPSTRPFPLKQLTHGQYDRLAGASGRELNDLVHGIFAAELEQAPAHWRPRLA